MIRNSLFVRLMMLTAFILCVFSPSKAWAFVANTYNVAAGSRFNIYSTQAGLDAFHEKPTVYVIASFDEKTHSRSVKVMEPGAYPCSRITCQWMSSKTPPGTYQLWIQPRNQGETENAVLISDSFSVRKPVITSLQRDASLSDKVIVAGRFFGSDAPLIKVSYASSDGEEGPDTIICPVLKPLAFPDGDGREGESCMNVETGESRVEFTLPQEIPQGIELRVHLGNRTGQDTATLKAMERDDLIVEIKASPELGGTTSPSGFISVKPDEPVEISATTAQGFRFVGWEASGNIDLLNSDLLSAVMTPKENGTLLAVFEAVQLAFEGIMSASAAIISVPDSDSVVSSANLTWNPAFSADTPASGIKYHIYVGDTNDVDLLYREDNLVETVTGVTEASIPLEPIAGAVYFVLAVAEDETGNRNENHRPVRVLNEAISFKKRIKDVGAIVSAESTLSLSEDEKVLTIKNGDYWSSFDNEDVILFDAGGRQYLNRVNLVYLEGEDTILWVTPATFDDAIQTGTWSAESYAPDTQDAAGRRDSSFTGTLDFGQGVTVHGRFIIRGLTVGFKSEFPESSDKVAKAWLKGTLGFQGRLSMDVQAGANNNPGERQPFMSGRFTTHAILDQRRIRSDNNLVVELFLYFRAEKTLRFVQSINIQKRFDVAVEIHSDEANNQIIDNSDDLVFDSHCSSSEFSDMEIYFKVRPKLVSSLLDRNPDYSQMSLGIEEKIRESTSGFIGFKAFDITADVSASYSYSAKNFWLPTEYITKHFSGGNDPIFSLPFISITGPYYVEQDTTATYVLTWRDGLHNQVYPSQVVWDCYHEDFSAAYGISAGPVIKTEDGYKRNLYFTPRTLGQWSINASAKGNGFLDGDLGVVYDSVGVMAYEP